MAEARSPVGRDGILALFVRHATLANLLMAIMLIAGLFAAPRLRAQFFPDTVTQTIEISVEWDKAGAEDVDTAIVGVLEPALMSVDGVIDTQSRATEGRALIEVEFEPGWDMSRAMAEVEAAVASAGDLPEDAEDPDIARDAWRDRVADVVISGPLGVDQLGRFADDLLTRLYARGITRVTVLGFSASETLVSVPMEALIRHDLTLSDIAAVIAAGATPLPAGDVSSGAARVRTGTEQRDPAAIRALVLRAEADGTALTVGDVADVRVEGGDRSRAFYVAGNPAVVLSIERSAAGDAIRMQRDVEAVLAEMRPGLPKGAQLDLIRARAEVIEARLQLLLDNAAMGLGLVLALLFLFLNARTALWVAAGIPTALLTAIAVMYATGMTLNMISLFALILTLGIIVDDAIVVGEHADFRARRLGEPATVAAENAARRMAAPVMSSTMTTVIAFAGLALIGGHFGRMVSDIPLTVIVVLLGSLLECFLVLPHHMAHALRHIGEGRWYDAPQRYVNRGLAYIVLHGVRRLIRAVLVLRYPVLAGVLALLAWAMAALISGAVPWQFWNAPERASISGNFVMLPGATRADSLAVMHALEAAVDTVGARYEAEYGVNPITYAIAEIGGNTGRPLPGAETRDADQLGSISVELIDPDLRPYSSFEFIADLQAAAPAHPRLETISFRGFRTGPGGDAISVMLSGAGARQLKIAAEALKAQLAAIPEVSALEDNMAYDNDELVLSLTPQGRALGFTTEALARELRNRLAGIEAVTYPDGPRSAAIRVEMPERDLEGDFLDRMLMRTTAGQWVPLGDIVTVTTRAGFSAIRRENGVRQITVTGDIEGGDPARAAQITADLENRILPGIAAQYGIDFSLTGLAEQERDFLSEALTGFALALIGIFLVLAWIFASWTRPIVVMAVIPFGLVGAVWGHYLWDLPMSMFSIVGLIGMSGIIINDSIVLISTIDDYSKQRGLRPAIVDAVCDRFRPVLLTTLTTVLGLAPLLYERSSQALFLKPTVVTLAYGLGFGMLVVLLVVPAVLGVGEDLGHARRALRRGLRWPRLRGSLVFGGALVVLAALLVLGPLTLAPVLGVAAPGWLPVAASLGQALLWYLLAVVLAVTLTGVTAAIRLSSR